LKEQFVVALTTFPADGDANAFAKALVDERLAACVNVLPVMRSVYTWKGSTESADERQIVIKTTRAKVPLLEARLKHLHPYDLPECVILEISGGSADYLSWLSESTKP
jgi:periplasmic divalent cation tolerance protein